MPIVALLLLLVSMATLGLTLHQYQEARRRQGQVIMPGKQRDPGKS